MSLTFFTGFEYGLGTPSINGGGLIDAKTAGGVTIVNDVNYQHSGSYCLKTTVASGGTAYITINVPGTPNTKVDRYYFNIAGSPSGDCILYSVITTGHKIQVSYKNADKKLYIGVDGGMTVAGPVIAGETFYRIDLKIDIHANPWLVDWEVDGAVQTQLSYAHAAETISAVYIGVYSTGFNIAMYFDDIAFSTTLADYPIGDGGVFGLRPASDGVHNNGANILEDSAGHDIDGVTYFAYSLLNDDPWTASSDRVQQTNVGAANYCEVIFATVPGSPTYMGVMGILQYLASGTTADTGGCVIRDGAGTETAIWGKSGALADYSESSAFYKRALIPSPGVSWTKADIDALRCRFGYSNNVTTKPYWTSVILEVAYKIDFDTIVETNAAVMVEDKEDLDYLRVTNSAVKIEDRPNLDWIYVTNCAIMIEWLPAGTLPHEAHQVI